MVVRAEVFVARSVADARAALRALLVFGLPLLFDRWARELFLALEGRRFFAAMGMSSRSSG
jgi:hypothetical protein